MSLDANWDIEQYKEIQERDDFWHLRRTFMEKWKYKYSEEKVVYLARAFANIALMGSTYPVEVMQEVAWMSKDLLSTPSNEISEQNSTTNNPIKEVSTSTSITTENCVNKRKIPDNIQNADVIDLTEPVKKSKTVNTPSVTINLLTPKPTLTVNGVQQPLAPTVQKTKKKKKKKYKPLYVEPIKFVKPTPPVMPDWTADVALPSLQPIQSINGIKPGNCVSHVQSPNITFPSTSVTQPNKTEPNNDSTKPSFTFNTLYVAVMTEPLQSFSVLQANNIREALERKLEEWIFSSPITIRFRGQTHLSGGVLKTWCEDQQSVNWLINEVDKLPSPIFGTKLVVRPQGISTEKVKCGLHVPTDKSVHEVRTLLAAQNPFVEVNSWVVSKADKQVDPPGLYMHLLVPGNDIIILRARERKLYWLLGDINILIIDKNMR